LAVLATDSGGRTALEAYLRERPDDPVALTRLAQLQQREGATEQAGKTYEKLIERNAQFTPAVRQLALLYAARPTDEPKAFDLLTKARLAYPDDDELAKLLGILNYKRKAFARAAELLQLSSARRRDDSELFYYLGMAHYQLKQFDQTKEALARSLTLGLGAALADDAKRALADCCQPAEQ
jgi:predicted Zn-dependent protease